MCARSVSTWSAAGTTSTRSTPRSTASRTPSPVARSTPARNGPATSGWADQLRSQEQALRAQLARPQGQRFPRGSGLELTYDVDQVDDLCLRIEDAFASGRPLAPEAVRMAVFKSRRGARGYREASVDAFLDRVVELLVVAAV